MDDTVEGAMSATLLSLLGVTAKSEKGAAGTDDKVLPFYGNTHTDDSHVGSKTTRLVHKAARYIKRCMGAGRADALVFCGAGTTAAIKRLQEIIGVALPSVEMRNWLSAQLRDEERWVVFVGPYEHHSNLLSWRQSLAEQRHRRHDGHAGPYEHHSNLLSWRQSLAEVVEVGVDAEGLVDVAALRRALGSPEYAGRPMLGSFSACSNVTGVMTDTREIARVLHQHGAFACFDFAASGPYVKIDMKSGETDGYDAVFLSPHKFVGGPGTPGILLMNKSLYKLNSQPPSTCGGGTVAYVNGFNEEDTLYYDDIEEREDAGTPPILQKIRASLAFWVKEYVGYDTMDLRERVFSEMAMKRLVHNPNVMVLGNTSAHRIPIFSFLIFPSVTMKEKPFDDFGEPSCDKQLETMKHKQLPLHGRFVTRLLNDIFGIQARGGCACAGPYGHTLLNVDNELSLRIRSAVLEGYSGLKPGWTRLSFSYYLSKEEFKFILSAIEFIATYGHRFLSLYKFDWITGNWTFRKQAVKYHIMREELSLHIEPLKQKKDQPKLAYMMDKPAVNDKKFQSYLDSANKIALSMPDISNKIVSFPKGVDPDLVLFHI
uniref:Putative cysteine desulfurase n=1 Tax=Aegilops tauschii TaxID=37682 RepID=M8BAV9_AEGTA